MLRKNIEPVIIDLGSCEILGKESYKKMIRSSVGSPVYMSPEAFLNN